MVLLLEGRSGHAAATVTAAAETTRRSVVVLLTLASPTTEATQRVHLPRVCRVRLEKARQHGGYEVSCPREYYHEKADRYWVHFRGCEENDQKSIRNQCPFTRSPLSLVEQGRSYLSFVCLSQRVGMLNFGDESSRLSMYVIQVEWL